MKARSFPRLIVLGFLFFACGESAKQDDESSPSQANPSTDYSAESEAVSPPQPVTGTFLSCSPATAASDVATIYCAFFSNNTLANLDEIFVSYNWSVEGFDDEQIEALSPSSGFNVAFRFPSRARDEEEAILLQGKFILDGQSRDGQRRNYRNDSNYDLERSRETSRDGGDSSGGTRTSGDSGGTSDGGDGSRGGTGDGGGGGRSRP